MAWMVTRCRGKTSLSLLEILEIYFPGAGQVVLTTQNPKTAILLITLYHQ